MKKLVKVCTTIGAVLSVIALGFFIYSNIGVIQNWYHTAENWLVSEYTEAKDKTAQIKYILSGNPSATTTENEEVAETDEEIMYAALRATSDQYLRQTYPDLSEEQIAAMIDGFISNAKNGPFAWTINTAQNAIVAYYNDAYQAIQQSEDPLNEQEE